MSGPMRRFIAAGMLVILLAAPAIAISGNVPNRIRVMLANFLGAPELPQPAPNKYPHLF